MIAFHSATVQKEILLTGNILITSFSMSPKDMRKHDYFVSVSMPIHGYRDHMVSEKEFYRILDEYKECMIIDDKVMNSFDRRRHHE